jgi:hypothetical protein
MTTFPIRPRQSDWLDTWLASNLDLNIEGYTDTDPIRVMLSVTDEQYDRLLTAASLEKSKGAKQLVKHLGLAKARFAKGEPPIPVKAARPKVGAAARGEVATARREAKERIQAMRDAKPTRVQGEIRVKVTKGYWMEWVQRNRIKHTTELRVDVKSNYIAVELHPKDAHTLVYDTMNDARQDTDQALKKKAATMWKSIGDQFPDQNFEEWK